MSAPIVDHFTRHDASMRRLKLIEVLCNGDESRKTYRAFPEYRAQEGQLWTRLGKWTA
jgi:hypothetical protein